MIEIKNINKSFSDDKGNIIKVLSDFSLEIEDSKFYTIVGPNGCGKSTLLSIIVGAISQDSGQIIFPKQTDSFRIGYVWQDYRSSLLPWYNVIDNITFPLKIMNIPKKERNEAAINLYSTYKEQYDSLSIDLNKKIYELSGGQQQLVNLLRNMIIRPDIFLLDEPFSALDQFNRWSMSFLFQELWLKLKIPVLFISHDVDEATLLADEILLMNKKGQIEKRIKNDLPRKRTKEMLATTTHINCRNEIIDFLFNQKKL